MQSASSVGFSDTPTFTFWQVGYSSVWVDLQEVERYGSLNPTGGGFMPLQTPTAPRRPRWRSVFRQGRLEVDDLS
jgi:hypothetical protein